MALTEEIEQSGNWLFKRRGYLPIVLLAAGIIVLMFNELNPGRNFLITDVVCLFISFLGLAIRAFTIGYTPRNTSGRNIKGQIAEVVNTTGIYSIVRHPLYLGNFVIWLGLSLFTESPFFIVIFILAFWLYYERIMFAEEQFLKRKFGKEYEEWANKTPSFFPAFSNWAPGNLPFSWKNIFKREYNGFGNIIFAFTILAIVRNYIITGNWYPELRWIIIFFTGLIIWVLVRTIEKKTNLFFVEGR
jgi:protein-S-isoprenylcysteine O-methyltransferase Ste14